MSSESLNPLNPSETITFVVVGPEPSPDGAIGYETSGTRLAAFAAALEDGRVVAGHKGCVVVEFDTAVSALTQAMREVSDLRVGIHTLAADRRTLGVDQTSRLMAAAHPGQIVCSSATALQARDELPEDLSLKDLGVWRLLDFDEAQHLYQLSGPDLQRAFPALRAVPGAARDLPLIDTTFIGRDRDLIDLGALVAENRFVTLVGPGGVGKTRLAYEVVKDLAPRFTNGATVVQLGSVDPGQVVARVAETLGLQDEAETPLIETVIAALSNRTLLLVLDNCEHVHDEVRQFVSQVIDLATHVRVLTTSRRPIEAVLETVYSLATLEVPEPTMPWESLIDVASIQLFVDRARNATEDFAVNEETAEALGRICRHLDGLPLAIELAAAQIHSLSLSAVADLIDETLGLQTSGPASFESRQDTMSTLITWSLHLLSEEAQRLFARLSVFRGMFDLGDVEMVCGFAPLEPSDAANLLGALTRDSLVVSEPGNRFRMLVVIRDIAAGYLATSGEFTTAHDAHLDFFSSLFEPTNALLAGPQQIEWMRRLDLEIDNCRAGLEWGTNGDGDPEKAGLLAGSLENYWIRRGLRREGHRWLEAGLAKTTGKARLRALFAGGRLAHEMGHYEEAAARLNEGIIQAVEIGAREESSYGLGWLGVVDWYRGDFAGAAAHLESALSIAEEFGNVAGQGLWHSALGALAGSQCDYASATRHHRAALATSRETGDEWMKATARGNLGDVAALRGEYTTASANIEAAIEITRQIGDRSGEGHWLAGLGLVAGGQGDYPTARRHLIAGFEIAQEVGDRVREGWWLTALADIAAIEGDDDEAANFSRLSLEVSHSAAARARAMLAFVARRSEQPKVVHEQALLALRDFNPDRWMLTTALALLAASLGGTQAALIGAALDAWSQQTGSVLSLPHSRWLAEAMTEAKNELDEPLFADCLRRGALESLEEVAETVLRHLETSPAGGVSVP